MVLLPIPDVSTRTAALLSGRVDWIEAPAPDLLDKLRAGGCKIETNAIPHMWPYTLSMLPGALTADIRARLNLAIDRDAMVKLLNGLAAPRSAACRPTIPGSNWSSRSGTIRRRRRSRWPRPATVRRRSSR